MAVWKSSFCRKGAHPDMAAAIPASVTTPAPALLSMQPGSMHPLAAVQSNCLLQQRREQQQCLEQQQQHPERQGLGRPLQAPEGTPVAPLLPQADHVQQVTQLQRGELPGKHAQAKGQGAKQALVPLTSPKHAQHAGPAQQAQTAGPTKQAQHAGPAQQARTADPAKQAQHAPQQAQHTPQAEHALLAQSPQQRQHALQAKTNTQQAVPHSTEMPPAPQAVLPQTAQPAQHAALDPPHMVSQQSQQLNLKRAAPRADVNPHAKRRKVSTMHYAIPLYSCYVHLHPLQSTMSTACSRLTAWYAWTMLLACFLAPCHRRIAYMLLNNNTSSLAHIMSSTQLATHWHHGACWPGNRLKTSLHVYG